MKRFLSLAVVFSMILSMFAGITVTTAAADVTETRTLFSQTYEDDCTSVDMKTVVYGKGEIVDEAAGVSNKVMKLTPDGDTATVLSCVNQEIMGDKYTLTFDMRAVSPNAGFTVVVKNPFQEDEAGFSNGYSLLIAPGTFVSTGADGKLSVVDDAWYTYTVDVDVAALNGAEITASQESGRSFITLSRKNRDTGVEDSAFGFNAGSSSNAGVRFGLATTSYTPSNTPDGVSFVTTKGNTRWGSDQAALGTINSDTYYPYTNYQVDNVSVVYEYNDPYTYVVSQSFDDDATDFLTPFYGNADVITETGTSNKVLDLSTPSKDTVIGTSTTATNIPSDQYTISFDMRAVSPNAGLILTVKNPYHATNPGFTQSDTYNGYALIFAPGTFVSKDESGYLNTVDDAWYTYTVTVDVDKLEGATLAAGRTCGNKFITLSRKNRDTGVADASFGFNNDSASAYGVRFVLAKDNVSSQTPNGVSFFTRSTLTRWKKDITDFSGSIGDAFVDVNYQLDNIMVYYEEAQEEEVTDGSITNIVMQLGGNITERNFTWFSTSSDTGYLTYAKADELVDGAIPATAAKITATRDGSGVSLKAGYYNNKATIKDLEPGETYYYQLINGTDVSEMFSFEMGEESSTFSFAYIGDAQMGAGSLGVPQNTLDWERTLNQLTTDPAFEGIEFMASAGDQISTNTSSPNYTDNELQYDGYLNHPQFTSLAQTSLLGNHDNWSRGSYYQHFNEPNYIIDEETGEYYGVTKYNSYVNSADYWYTYNSVLFISLNVHNMNDADGTEGSRADDKAVAEKHLEFIDKVLELNKDNTDILWKVLFYHESPYGSSYHGNYKKDENGDYKPPTGRTEQYMFINMREYLLPGVYDRKFDVILSGHDHCYTRTHILKHEAIDTEGMYYGNETITPFRDRSYTYADGTTTPTYKDFTDANGVVHKNVRTTSTPVKVTDPDGVLHITASSSSGSQCNGTNFFHPYAAVQVGHTTAIRRQAMRIDVTPTTMTFTNYGLGSSIADVDPAANVLDTFTIEKTAKISVKGVSLPKTAEIPVGQTEELTAKFSPVDPENANVTWKSDNETVAKVDENGVVTAIAEGVANITVTTEDGGYTATCAVNVVAATAVTGVTVDNTALELTVGDVKTINATVSPDNATTKDVIWTTTNASVATVTANGSITALTPGTVTITATTKDGAKTATCTVTVNAIAATAVVIDVNAATMKVMDEETLSATVYPANATYQTITWTSSDASIVSVDENGKLKALKQGTATITAVNSEGVSSKCAVTVMGGILFEQTFEDESNGAFVNKSIAEDKCWTRVQDEDDNWILKMNGAGITDRFVNGYWPTAQTLESWSIPDSNFVFAFDICRTSNVGYRTMNIRFYTCSSAEKGIQLDTNSFDTGVWYDIKISYTGSTATVYYKKKTDATYSVLACKNATDPTGGANKIHFSLAKDSYATTVDQIRQSEMLFDNMQLYVDIPVTKISLDKSAEALNVGDTLTLNSTITPSNATDTHITYTTSDASVATVTADGKVKAVGGGTATITVTAADGGQTAVCIVTVKGKGLTVTRDGWKFTVSTNENIMGDMVYVAAYDSNERLIGAGMSDFDTAAFTEVTMTAPTQTPAYFKAFVWDSKLTPAIDSARLEY